MRPTDCCDSRLRLSRRIAVWMVLADTSLQIWNTTWLLMKRVSLSGGMLLGRPSGRNGCVLPVTSRLPGLFWAGLLDCVGGVTTAAGVEGCESTVVTAATWILDGGGSRSVWTNWVGGG